MTINFVLKITITILIKMLEYLTYCILQLQPCWNEMFSIFITLLYPIKVKNYINIYNKIVGRVFSDTGTARVKIKLRLRRQEGLLLIREP